jgi:hypothetical protein
VRLRLPQLPPARHCPPSFSCMRRAGPPFSPPPILCFGSRPASASRPSHCPKRQAIAPYARIRERHLLRLRSLLHRRLSPLRSAGRRAISSARRAGRAVCRCHLQPKSSQSCRRRSSLLQAGSLPIHAGSLIRYTALTASSSPELSAFSPATSFCRLESESKPLPTHCCSHPTQPPPCSLPRSPCRCCHSDRS